jgi:hypothetical protein
MKSESRVIIKITVEARDSTMGGDDNCNLVLDDRDKVKLSKALYTPTRFPCATSRCIHRPPQRAMVVQQGEVIGHPRDSGFAIARRYPT